MGLDSRAEELLHAIDRNPEDNEVRLAFAKHIASEAPVHAALIVAQCNGNDDPALVGAFIDELPEPLQQLAPVRGFLEVAQWQLEERDFLAIEPDVLFRIAPSCTSLGLLDVTDYDAVGARLRRFDRLAIRGTYFDGAVARRFAAARGFAHLQELRLDCGRPDDAALFELYQALPALERISFQERHDTEYSFLDMLRRAPCASTLRELEIHGRRELPALDLRGFSALRNLRALHCVVDAGFAFLPNRFHAVELWYCELTSALRGELHESRVFSKLRELRLMANVATTETLTILLSSAHCGPLRSIEILDHPNPAMPRPRRGDALHLVQAIANVTRSLEQLQTGFLDDDALRALAETPFVRLAWLTLLDPLTPAAAHALATARWIHGLREFTFDISRLDEAGARALAGALGPDCRVVPLGESEQEVFDAFGIPSEEVPDGAE